MKAVKKIVRKYYKYGFTPNVTIVGIPSVFNGVASGFSNSNYLTLPETFNPGSDPWEICLKIKMHNNSKSGVFIGNNSSGYFRLGFTTTNNIALLLSTTSNSWSIGSITSTSSMVNDAYSWVKATFDGTKYQIFLSTDGENYNLENTLTTSSIPAYQNVTTLGAGNTSATGDQYTQGDIDLNESYIKINGKDWWHGTIAETGYYTYYPDITITGDVKIYNGKATNFLDGFRVSLPYTYKSQNNAEYVVKFTTPSSTYSTAQAILHSESFISVEIPANSWNIISYNWGSSTSSTILTVSPNTTYWVKVVANGTTRSLYYSTDGETYIFSGSFTDSKSSISSSYDLYYGNNSSGPTHPFHGSIDLNECYISINNEKVWQPEKIIIDENNYDFYKDIDVYSVVSGKTKKYYKYGNTPDVTKVGNPTVNNGVASGFSNGNNFTFPSPLNFSGETWEMVFKVTTGSSTSTQNTITGNYGNTYQNSPEIAVINQRFRIGIPKDGSNTLLVNNVSGTYTVLSNTTYWIKLYWTGSAYKLDYSLDGETWINDITVNNSTAMYSAATQGATIGCNYANTNTSQRFPWLGSIDFTGSYIKVNDKLWWNGTLAEKSTYIDYDFYRVVTKTYAVRS